VPSTSSTSSTTGLLLESGTALPHPTMRPWVETTARCSAPPRRASEWRPPTEEEEEEGVPTGE